MVCVSYFALSALYMTKDNNSIPIERPDLEEETREWRERRMEEGREIWVARARIWRKRRRGIKNFCCI